MDCHEPVEDKFDEDIFINMEEIPESFIHFKTIQVRIGGAKLEGDKIIFAVDKKYGYITRRGFSDVNIYEKRNGKFIRIATFYNWFNYTHGFRSLITEKLGDYIKIVIVGENNDPDTPKLWL